MIVRSKNNILSLQTVMGYSVNTTGLIKQSVALNAQLDFLQEYATLADDLSVLNYGDYLVRKNINPDNVKLYIANMLMSEKYNLKTLIDTLDLEYNPIENYNMVEHGTDHKTLEYAERNSNTELDYAQQKGETKLESGNKVVNEDVAHSVAPYNNSTLTKTSEDNTETTAQSYTDITTQTVSAHKDNTSRTDSAHTDEDTLVHDLTRAGNIGVTTTQQMIEAQRNLANVNVSKKIVELVVGTICKGVQRTL